MVASLCFAATCCTTRNSLCPRSRLATRTTCGMQSSSSSVRSCCCVQWLPLVVLGYGFLLPATRAALLLLPIQSLVAYLSRVLPLTSSPSSRLCRHLCSLGHHLAAQQPEQQEEGAPLNYLALCLKAKSIVSTPIHEHERCCANARCNYCY